MTYFARAASRPLSMFSTLLLLLVACAGQSPASTTPISDPVPMPTAAPTEPAPARFAELLAAYEHVRDRLAADDAPGVATPARALEAAAQAAQLASLARHAAALAATSDLAAARDAFGEVSRDVVSLLAADQSLARGYHVFECPMVKGYRKWVQPSEEMANPYMGPKMLACGGETTWEP
jgi:membrane fusion protein, copper/silver efflux system